MTEPILYSSFTQNAFPKRGWETDHCLPPPAPPCSFPCYLAQLRTEHVLNVCLLPRDCKLCFSLSLYLWASL